ncbi:hypothetical protein GG804_19655 [Sphingomonas histidinilytica]|uniref:lipopolysaccharide biosynthesis protein n=1 Tax=Rhizorhabdus histidinilytica TaxID=439228 RepID=UPI001ADD18A4|nr:hypothetical protein [Rhizorhabdus histidinilytica]MBO9378988.1 hypothetical protein [Rhizorhabdus histidinilytica]
MLRTVKRHFEVLVLRAAPGLLNLWALLLLGDWLPPAQYGVYSVGIVAAGFASSVVFGPLLMAVVSQHAHLDARGEREAYESSFLSLTIITALITALLGLLGYWLNLLRLEWIWAAVFPGIYNNIQELLRARIKIFSYGISSLLQSVIYLSAVYLIICFDGSVGGVWYAFSLSYAIASVMSAYFLGFPKIGKPDMSIMSSTWGIGFGYVLSTMAEQLMFLGTRWVVSVFGNPILLGVFSFSVDLAQRTVGFMVNTASFVFVPLAFKERAKNSDREFTMVLIRGAAMSFALSILTFFVLVGARELEAIPGLDGENFDTITFAIVSLAVVLNRQKKLIADPFAMAAGQPAALAMGYVVGAIITVPLAAFAYQSGQWRLGELAYPTGYLLASLVTILSLRKTLLIKEAS